ncbi:hypothetical protein JYU34_007640 [Plutella xylostella]|uniref:Uncharacterized protein n=1 Tax=Plutella xylostella TaxID=51655 RepID=A0ABQ7QQW7_PLUXY|nr:hypothetical protein JYU34_007640 [Plutella xylostella]
MRCFVLLGFIFSIVSSASVTDYKKYANYKVYTVSGDEEALKDFKVYVERFDGVTRDAQMLTGAHRRGLLVMVAPALEPEFLAAVSERHLTSTLINEYFSKYILEKRKSNMEKPRRGGFRSHFMARTGGVRARNSIPSTP